MSRTLELPDELYAALHEAATASGLTPADWIAAHLPASRTPAPAEAEAEPPRTLADLFAGRTGVIRSGGQERLSENGGKRFTDYLEEKRRAGRL